MKSIKKRNYAQKIGFTCIKRKTPIIGLSIVLLISLFNPIISYANASVYWTSRYVYGFESRRITIHKDRGGQIKLRDGAATIETRIIYKGKYAVKLEATRRAQIGRWKETRDKINAYYGCAIYIDPGFKTLRNKFHIIAQLHQMESKGIFVALRLTGNPPRFKLVSKINGHNHNLWLDSKLAPEGKWFTVIWHLVAKKDGKIEMWINTDPNRRPGAGKYIGVWRLNLKSDSRWPGPAFYTDVYQASGSPRNWVVVDEMICASSLREVVNFLNPS